APAYPVGVAGNAWQRYPWRVLCFLVLPALYMGMIREFSVGQGTIIPPSLVIVGAFALLCGAFYAFHLLRLRRFPLLFPMAGYFLAACLSGWHSVSHLHWLRGVMELGIAFCFLLFPYYFLQRRQQLELCLETVVALAVTTVVFAILQVVFFVPLRGVLQHLYRLQDLWWIVGWGWRGRLAGNWLHPSYLGSVLNIAAPFALLYCARAQTGTRRALAIACYLVLAAGIALTGTRTPLLAFVLSSVAFLLLARCRWRVWTALAGALVVAVTLSMFHFHFAPPDVGSKAFLPKSFSLAERLELQESNNTATLDMRWMTQGEALRLFRASPVFGIGMRNYPDRARGADPMAEFSIHDSLVQNLAELGVFGLAAFLILVVRVLGADFRPPLAAFPELRPLRAALFCSAAAILLESLLENSLAVWQVLALFWLLRGVALIISQNPAAFLNRPGPALESEHTSQPHPGSRDHLFDALETAVR
ncbi:MAG TPA: O-antigen ligase family protein, partial [Terriglobales bacterium]|nr:O-antigen ligase family protein [Terriglobales bacterium]